MCGRYMLFSTAEQITRQASELLSRPVGVASAAFDASRGMDFRPNGNVSPTQPVPILRGGTVGPAQPPTESSVSSEPCARESLLGPARWGFDVRIGGKRKPVFNARLETLAEKTLFRTAEPCLFMFDGWYEWKDRQPWLVTCAADEDDETNATRLMFIAGLCRVGGAEGEYMEASMVTTAAVSRLEWLHHRMPRLLTAEEAQRWLSAGRMTAGVLSAEVPGCLVESLRWQQRAPA